MTFLRTPNWVVMKQSKAHTAGQEDKVLVTHDGPINLRVMARGTCVPRETRKHLNRALVEVEDRYEAALDATGGRKHD